MENNLIKEKSVKQINLKLTESEYKSFEDYMFSTRQKNMSATIRSLLLAEINKHNKKGKK